MHTKEEEAPSKAGKVFNVYMQEINPTNNMPKNPNQVRQAAIAGMRKLALPSHPYHGTSPLTLAWYSCQQPGKRNH